MHDSDTRSQFADAPLHPVVMENLQLMKYDRPTPIQKYTIPAVLNDMDVVAIAQTGMPCELLYPHPHC